MVDSVKKWQMTFFYVRNESPAFDRINLTDYNPEPPTARLNWGVNCKPADPDAEVNMLWNFLEECVAEERLCAADLLCCYASRQAQVAKRVNSISQAKLAENWGWGMEPYHRADLPPLQAEDGDLALKNWTPDHIDPADQAGDDENPEAADQAAHGHDDPPPSPQPHEEELEVDMPTSSAPIRAVPLAARLPATSASSTAAPKGRKRPTERTTAQLEAKLKKQRRRSRRAAIKFSKGVGSGPASGVVSPLQRQRREPTPQPLPRSRMPPIIPPPATGAGLSSAAPSPGASASGSRSERARRAGQPSIDDLFPRRSRPIEPAGGAGRAAPPAGAGRAAPPAGAGRAAPDVVVLDGSPDTVLPLESTIPTGPAGPAVPPPASEPGREESVRQEPDRPADTDARTLVKAKGPTQAPEGPTQPLVSLHVSPATSLLNVVSASDSSLGSAGTMEKEWCQADAGEVTSREGSKGRASMEMFFSSFRAYAKAATTEIENRLARLEMASKAVEDKRTALYHRLVASYHKAKIARADMACELEAAKAAAAWVPQLEEDLRVARAQCVEAEKVAKAAAAKAQETDGELARLRQLKEKVDDLSKRLEEVDRQRLELREEVTSKSNELTATAKRWVEEISSLDRGLAGWGQAVFLSRLLPVFAF
nr:uncharacterized protein LOC127303483 [Lolium perenne]